MELGDKHTVDGKEYVAVYSNTNTCERCECTTCDKIQTLTGTECEVFQNGRYQQIVWIEVKK